MSNLKDLTPEKTRQSAVRIIFVIYWLLILEGALRKWILPQVEEILFFIRVPFVVYLYITVFYSRLWPQTSLPLFFTYLFAIISIIFLPIQLLQGDYNPRYLIIWGYGWHNYFFYIPLAFIIAEQFRQDDFNRIVRHTLWLGILAAPIVLWQFWSPMDSVINMGGRLDELAKFKNLGAALGFVRPTGFFSSTMGQSQFIISLFAILLTLWLLPSEQRNLSRLTLWGATIAALSMLALSGSRTSFIFVGIVLVGAFYFILITWNKEFFLRGIVIPSALLITFLIGFPLAFPMAFEVFTERWTGAALSESSVFEYGTLGRIFYNFYGFAHYLADTPLVGYLLGISGNATAQLNWVERPEASYYWTGYGNWGEQAWERHIIELGPLVGLLFITFRVWLLLWLARKVFHAAQRNSNPWALLLFMSISSIILTGHLGHGTTIGYIWIFFGLVLFQSNRPTIATK